MNVPKRAPYVVVGAGIHGLSTAYHLAGELSARGLGSGADVLVLDKARPGAGASGLACGVARDLHPRQHGLNERREEPGAARVALVDREKRVQRVEQSGTRRMAIPAMGSRITNAKHVAANSRRISWTGALRPSSAAIA